MHSWLTFSVKVGINLPQFGKQRNDELSILRDFVEKAERLRFDSVWVQDKCFQKNVSFIEPMTSLAFAAAYTAKIELGAAAIILPLKDPVMLTKIAATIDFLSDNRLILGVALGNSQDYVASCVPTSQRVPRFLEALQVMRMLCTREDVNFEGEHFQLSHASISPRPNRKNGFPIWIGGGEIGSEVKDTVIRRAARLGDGWIGAGSTDITAFRNSCRKFEFYCKEFGKEGLIAQSIAKRIYIHVDHDREKARQTLRERLSALYNMEFDVDKLCIFGDEKECASQLADVLQSGNGTIILNSVTDYLDQEEILMKDVIVNLK